MTPEERACEAIRAAVAEEREACAMVAQRASRCRHYDGGWVWTPQQPTPPLHVLSREIPCSCVHNGDAIKIAAAIRARGKA